MKYEPLFAPLNLLTSFTQLQGKTILYCDSDSFDKQRDGQSIVFLTHDGSVLIAFGSEENEQLVLSILSNHLVHDTIACEPKFRKAFSQYGYFNIPAYETMRLSELDDFTKSHEERQLERERAEYERLKSKFEPKGDN